MFIVFERLGWNYARRIWFGAYIVKGFFVVAWGKLPSVKDKHQYKGYWKVKFRKSFLDI